MRLMRQEARMAINRLIVFTSLLCASHSGMCRIIENELVQPIEKDYIVISSAPIRPMLVAYPRERAYVKMVFSSAGP